MSIGPNLLLALGVALLATLLYCLINSVWNWRTFVSMWAYGAVLVFGAVSGPIRIGS